MSYEIGVADLEAMKDVAEGLSDLASSLSAEQSVILLDAARDAHKALDNAIAFLESRAIQQIEQPILVSDGRGNTTAWSKKAEFKKRPNMTVIRSLVNIAAIDAVIDRDTGEVSPMDAVAKAISLMEGLYVSPSTMPKVGGVKELGVEFDEVFVEEHTGYTLKKVDL